MQKDPSRPAYSYLSTPSHLLTYDLFPTPVLALYNHDPSTSASDACPSPITLDLPPSPTSLASSFSGSETFFSLLNSLQLHLAAHTDLTSSAPLCSADWKAGWVGWFGYEMKEETLLGYTRPEALKDLPERAERTGGHTNESCFAYTERVLAFEHETSTWVAMGLVEVTSDTAGVAVGVDVSAGGKEVAPSSLASLLSKEGIQFGISPADWTAWIAEMDSALRNLSLPTTQATPLNLPTPDITRFAPDHPGAVYSSLIDEARNSIHEGESYELTLTTQFRSDLTPTTPLPSPTATPSSPSTTPTSLPRDLYALYKKLRKSNPAPYSSFVSFPVVGTAVVSSSPERFIKIGKGGEVEMKPIKGTIGRCLTDEKEDTRRRDALQADRKEIAENLMVSPIPCFLLWSLRPVRSLQN